MLCSSSAYEGNSFCIDVCTCSTLVSFSFVSTVAIFVMAEMMWVSTYVHCGTMLAIVVVVFSLFMFNTSWCET